MFWSATFIMYFFFGYLEKLHIECRWIKLVIDQLLETYQSSVIPLYFIPAISAVSILYIYIYIYNIHVYTLKYLATQWHPDVQSCLNWECKVLISMVYLSCSLFSSAILALFFLILLFNWWIPFSSSVYLSCSSVSRSFCVISFSSSLK